MPAQISLSQKVAALPKWCPNCNTFFKGSAVFSRHIRACIMLKVNHNNNVVLPPKLKPKRIPLGYKRLKVNMSEARVTSLASRRQQVDPSKLCECSHCDIRFLTMYHLEQHLDRAHNPSIRLFMTPEELEELGNEDLDQEVEKEDDGFQCPKCPRILPSEATLDFHCYFRHKLRYTCSICKSTVFSRLEHLKHLEEAHDGQGTNLREQEEHSEEEDNNNEDCDKMSTE